MDIDPEGQDHGTDEAPSEEEQPRDGERLAELVYGPHPEPPPVRHLVPLVQRIPRYGRPWSFHEEYDHSEELQWMQWAPRDLARPPRLRSARRRQRVALLALRRAAPRPDQEEEDLVLQVLWWDEQEKQDMYECLGGCALPQ